MPSPRRPAPGTRRGRAVGPPQAAAAGRAGRRHRRRRHPRRGHQFRLRPRHQAPALTPATARTPTPALTPGTALTPDDTDTGSGADTGLRGRAGFRSGATPERRTPVGRRAEQRYLGVRLRACAGRHAAHRGGSRALGGLPRAGQAPGGDPGTAARHAPAGLPRAAPASAARPRRSAPAAPRRGRGGQHAARHGKPPRRRRGGPADRSEDRTPAEDYTPAGGPDPGRRPAPLLRGAGFPRPEDDGGTGPLAWHDGAGGYDPRAPWERGDSS